jgi:segregation and condensation protein A
MAEPIKIAAENISPAKQPESDFPFAVSVGLVYEGPLDLLLDLIRKQDSIWRMWKSCAS